MAVGNVMETEAQRSSEHTGGWKAVKLKQARRMLLKGLSPQKIGASVRLPLAEVEELMSELDFSNVVPLPEVEGFPAWRARKRREIGIGLVRLVEGHFDALAKSRPLLDPKAMTGLRHASNIAHQWLESDEAGGNTPALNFAALAQVQST